MTFYVSIYKFSNFNIIMSFHSLLSKTKPTGRRKHQEIITSLRVFIFVFFSSSSNFHYLLSKTKTKNHKRKKKERKKEEEQLDEAAQEIKRRK